MPRISRASLIAVTAALVVGFNARPARAADTVVQVPLTDLLDARSVTTLNNGVFKPWTLPTDGGGLQNAFMTAAGATMLGKPSANAVPDDGHFPADTRHPDVVLHFSNSADPTSPQTHLVPVSGTFKFAVPAGTYSKFFLFFNGAANGTTVKITYTYSDATSEVLNATIPDYYADVAPTDKVIFNLAPDLAKWSKTNTLTEANHHHITGAELDPTMPTKTLVSVQVERGPNGYLVFWGATGVATSTVAGTGGSGGSAGATDAAGAAGTGGTGGTSTAGGVGGALMTAGASGMPSAGAGAGGAAAGVSGSANAGANASAGSTALPNSSSPDAGGCSFVAAKSGAARAFWLVLGMLGACALGRRRQTTRRAS